MNRAPVKIYIALLIGLLIFSIAAFIFIVTVLDPTGSKSAILTFYLNLFILTLSSSALLAYYLRQSFGQRELSYRHLVISFRQGLWFSLLIVVSMNLQVYGLFSALNAMFLTIALIFLEAYFVYNKKA